MQSKKQFCNLIFRIISRATTAALAMATVFALTFVLTHSAQAQTFKVIHNFSGGGDGGVPTAGVIMDEAGNLYGTTCGSLCGYGGGNSGNVFKLTHKNSAWIINPLYTFSGGNDGGSPGATVVFGPDGNLYGTTYYGGGDGCGGSGCGTVFQLKPYPTACKTAICGWQETVLYRFTGGSDGATPGRGDLIFDKAGNLYGTAQGGGNQAGVCSEIGGCGVVFELTPSNGGWTESVLYSFTGGSDGAAPPGGVIFNNIGNLYSTTTFGGNLDCVNSWGLGCGTVFELTPSGQGWTENVLYTFQNGNDGRGWPYVGLIFDNSGNLYGTTVNGGANGGGSVFKLTPSNGGWTFATSFSFPGGFDTAGPEASLTMDAAGNLYGTTIGGGYSTNGTVFKLTASGGGWTYTDFYDFSGEYDGGSPQSNVILDANGNLYGTAVDGQNGSGVVWEITFP